MQKGRENFFLKARQSAVHITITENLKLIRVILERRTEIVHMTQRLLNKSLSILRLENIILFPSCKIFSV